MFETEFLSPLHLSSLVSYPFAVFSPRTLVRVVGSTQIMFSR